MSYLYYNPDDYQMSLSNSCEIRDVGNRVATMESTGGYGNLYQYICPVCGHTHSDSSDMCESCRADHFEQTLFGQVFKCRPATYKNKSVPSVMLQNGKPTQAFNAYIALKRICDSTFEL